MRIFLGYAKSHIYDIHAALVAVITIFTMYYIKKPIKQKNEKRVDEKLTGKPELESKRTLYLKRANMILLFLTMLLAFLLFALASFVSPMIDFSVGSAVMSGVFALAGYAFWDQITYGMRR